MTNSNRVSADTINDLHAMLFDFGYDLDVNCAENVESFFEETGSFVLNGTSYDGHAGIRGYHDARGAQIQEQHPEGRPAGRHALTNIRITLERDDVALLRFLAFFYAGSGTDKKPDLLAVSVVVDNLMTCRRQSDGRWLIARLETDQILIKRDT